MPSYSCALCSHLYDEEAEGTPLIDLSDNWVCPICGSGKEQFIPSHEPATKTEMPAVPSLPKSYTCELCSFVHDEAEESVAWDDLPDDWVCPVCGSPKSAFTANEKSETKPVDSAPKEQSSDVDEDYLQEWRRPADDVETHMADIHHMAMHGKTVISPMRSQVPTISWSEILFKGAQLAKIPLNKSQPVNSRTIIGPNAACPLVIETPITITHMSYGALSPEAKLALSKGSARVKSAMCSGEGGILPESMESAYKYIFEYVPNKYSVTDENLQGADAVEIKIGQSAKPGMGGHLPGNKVTKEIAKVRGMREGKDVISPSHFPDILTPEDLKKRVEWLREKTGGKPIGVKVAAGNIEADLEVALFAKVDFITVDGRAGATGAAPKVVKDVASVPTVFALARARRFLDKKNAQGVSLIITGGFRVSADMTKALCMGADAIAIGSAAMMALGCQQYRICGTGRCPIGIATQDPVLRARLDVEKSANRVANFLQVCNDEIKDFSRMTGNADIHDMSCCDLCTANSEVSGYTLIEHV